MRAYQVHPAITPAYAMYASPAIASFIRFSYQLSDVLLTDIIRKSLAAVKDFLYPVLWAC